MKKMLKMILIVIVVQLLLWGYALVKCEILTHIYYDDFKHAYAQNTMLGDIEYFKVLNCNGNIAEVYYIGEGMSSGDVLSFEIMMVYGWKQLGAQFGLHPEVLLK